MKEMITIFADEGMILTDGEIYGTTISLAEGQTSEAFREITKEAFEEIMRAEAENTENI